MRATVQSSDLAAALKTSAAVGTTPMALLQHALLTASGDHLTMETTDCEITVRHRMPATVDQPGQVLMREALLRPVAAAAGEIRLSDDGTVSRGRSRYRIPSMDNTQDFPKPDPGEFIATDIDPGALAAAIRSVAYCGDEDDIRPALRAINITDNAVWCSDGNQVGYVAFEYDGPGLAIPAGQGRRVLDALQPGAVVKTAGNYGGMAGQLCIETDDSSITLRLLAVAPIAIKTLVIDTIEPPEARVVFNRQALAAAVRRFMPFAQWGGEHKYKNYTVAMEASRGELMLVDRTGDNREALADAVESLTGDFRFGVDPKRLLDALQAITTETLTLHPPNTAGKARGVVLMVPEGESADTVAHVIAQLVI